MLAVNYSTVRDNLKSYCDIVCSDNEEVVITRKGENNVVLLSVDQFNALNKLAKNTEYLHMLDRSFSQIKEGKCSSHNLIEVDDE